MLRYGVILSGHCIAYLRRFVPMKEFAKDQSNIDDFNALVESRICPDTAMLLKPFDGFTCHFLQVHVCGPTTHCVRWGS